VDFVALAKENHDNMATLLSEMLKNHKAMTFPPLIHSVKVVYPFHKLACFMFSSLAVHRRPGKQKPQSKESRWCSEKWCHWPQTDCNTRADTVHFLRFFPKKD